MKPEFPYLLLLASVGILILSVNATDTPGKSDIAELDKGDTGKKVALEAEIIEVSGRETAFLELKDETGSISAVHFDTRKRYRAGDRLLLTGRVGIHEGELQVVIEESSIIPS